jgi:hypothetical protein
MQTDEINRLNGIYKRLLSNAGVKLFEGEGKIAGPNEVEVTQLDGTKLSYTAKHILIATGSRAQRPNIPGQVSLLVSIYHCKREGCSFFSIVGICMLSIFPYGMLESKLWTSIYIPL